jgi:pimeloyl-ACP methyl ester carboxylesterase
MLIPYDSSREALFHPGLRPTVFQPGDADRLPIEAICAECSRLAYVQFEHSDAERERLLEALGRLGASDFAPFDDPDTDTQGFAVLLPFAGQPNRRRALVAFRGTEPDRLSDLGVDLQASAVAAPGGGRVHTGFLQSFRSIEAALDDWLASHAAAAPVFTGHSLGAALATLAAARRPDAQLVTFGSPRVGDEAFRDTVRGAKTRYLNCCDIVGRVPPETPWYTHVVRATYIDRHDAVREAPREEAASADRAAARIDYLENFAWRAGSVLVRDLADHAPINYVRVLVERR